MREMVDVTGCGKKKMKIMVMDDGCSGGEDRRGN